MGWDCRLHVASSLKNLIPGLLSEKLSTVFQSGSAFRIPTDSEAYCSVPSPATASVWPTLLGFSGSSCVTCVSLVTLGTILSFLMRMCYLCVFFGKVPIEVFDLF